MILGKSFPFSGLHIFPPTKRTTFWSDNLQAVPTLGWAPQGAAPWPTGLLEKVSPSVRSSPLKPYPDHNVSPNSDYNVYSLHPHPNSIHGTSVPSTRICYPSLLCRAGQWSLTKQDRPCHAQAYLLHAIKCKLVMLSCFGLRAITQSTGSPGVFNRRPGPRRARKCPSG